MKMSQRFADLMFEINNNVLEERFRQNDIWGPQRHDFGKWLGILIEEVGEVAQAINGIHFPTDAKETDANNLFEELIQVAAVASAIAEQVLEAIDDEKKAAEENRAEAEASSL